MSKQTNKKQVSIDDIILLFQTSPEQAYQELISFGYYFYKESKEFWEAYTELDHQELCKKFPNSHGVLNQVVWLKLFYDLNVLYESEKTKYIEQLTTLNPDETSLLKALFLCLELGDTESEPNNFIGYSEESLEAVKILLGDVLCTLKSTNQTSYSIELTNHVNNLIHIQVNMALLKEFLDAFIWGNLEMTKKENSKGFMMSLPQNMNKVENLLVLNYIKTSVKKDVERKESQPKISEEEHFKEIDLKFKTDKGLATIYISGGTIISQPEGTTFITVDNDYFKNSSSELSTISNVDITNFFSDFQEQNFHYQYRQALSKIYKPNDAIDIHTLYIEIDKNTSFSLYELLCAMSCLIAKADAFRYCSDFPMASVKSIKRAHMTYLEKHHSELTIEKLHDAVNYFIGKHLPEIEKLKEQIIFPILDLKPIIDWLKKIEELETKSDAELERIIDLFSGFDSRLPFNPLYKVNGQYYFSYVACGYAFNLNQLLYDNYISDKLFNPNTKETKEKAEKQLIGKTQKNREIHFNNSIKELFKTQTPFAEASLEYGKPNLDYDFRDLTGDFDVIAYFEEENIIFPIQAKLSNLSRKSEKRKNDWVTTQIACKGVKQVQKDVMLLQTESGLKFIADKLGIKSEIKNPLIYPLIVSDNFFADHVPFDYNEQGDYVLCISYFELKHLLFNQKVHETQTHWLPFEKNNAASGLIKMIEENSFWSFTGELAKEFHINKSLTAINEDLKITMEI